MSPGMFALIASAIRAAVVKSGALDPCAGGYLPRGRDALRDRGRVTLGHDSAGDHRALRHRIDLPVRSVERRHDERAANQRVCVADCGDGDVDRAARAGKGRQDRGDQNGGDVARSELLTRHVDPQPLQQVYHGLFGEGRIAQSVACPVQADDQTIADKIVAADAIELDQILDPCLARPRCRSREAQDQCHDHDRQEQRREGRRCAFLGRGRYDGAAAGPLSGRVATHQRM